MNPLKVVSDVFATLHDGGLDECEGNYEELWLKVSCRYLAELIEKDFDYFYLKLLDVKYLYFQEYDGNKQQIYNTIDLEQLNIELLYSKIESERVQVDCTKGVLYLLCNSIEIFDQARRPMSTQALFDIAILYWSNFHNYV
jgi:hypothetical protein